MPIRSIPNSNDNTPYYLICYDKEGNERRDDPDATNGVLSENVIRLAANGQYTDIMFICHGWKHDVMSASDQYDRWTAAMLACEQDIARLKARPQGFKPLVIGLHWPSLPFGMEEHNPPPREEDERNPLFNFSLETASAGSDIYTQAEDALADTEAGCRAVRIILDSVATNSAPEQLDSAVAAAIDYLLLHDVGVSSDTGTYPVDEALNTNATALYQALKQDADESLLSFGGGNGQGSVLGVITQLSFWKMKARARTFGENGGAKLLRDLMSVTIHNVQFHLMGHSFGTIVVSSSITGKDGHESLPRPVNTVYLVQGAVSYWSFCESIPVKAGVPGYYQMLSNPNYLAGPVLVTHTENDTAIKNFYVIAAKASLGVDAVSFDPRPKHGGLGMFGAQGDGIAIHNMELLPIHGNYGFTPHTFFNLHASNFIKVGNPLTGGAHGDIAHPEVAHAFWSAIH